MDFEVMGFMDDIMRLIEQPSSSVTVMGLRALLNQADIESTLMGYNAWGNFSFTQIIFVVGDVGYIAQRKKNIQTSSVTIKKTLDGKRIIDGGNLTPNEIEAFANLGLQSNKT